MTNKTKQAASSGQSKELQSQTETATQEEQKEQENQQTNQENQSQSQNQSAAANTSASEEPADTQTSEGDEVEEIDPLQTYKERKNELVDPERFSDERQGTHEQESEDEFENAGQAPEPEPEEEVAADKGVQFQAVKSTLRLSEFGLSKLHQKRNFTKDEQKRLKKIRRYRYKSQLDSEEDKYLFDDFQAIKAQEKEELAFDDEEIKMIADPLTEVLAKSNFNLTPEKSLMIAVVSLMIPRLIFVLQD